VPNRSFALLAFASVVTLACHDTPPTSARPTHDVTKTHSLVGPDGPFGVNINLYESANDASALTPKLQAANITWTRMDFDHAAIPFEPGRIDFTVNANVAAGINMLGTLSSSDNGAAFFGNMQLWRDFVTWAVSTYGNRISHWSIWNEPNSAHLLGPSSNNVQRGAFYDQLVAEAAPIIHAYGGRVVLPEIAWTVPGATEWFKERLAAFAPYRQAGDVASVHIYASPSEIVNAMQNQVVPAIDQVIPGLPVWLTEFARGEQPGIESEHDRIRALAEDLHPVLRAMPATPRWQKSFYYHLWVWNLSDPANPHRYGLLRKQADGVFTEQDGYWAFRNATSNCPECIGVHRWWRWGNGMWGLDPDEGYPHGFILEGHNAWFTSSIQYRDMVQLHRCHANQGFPNLPFHWVANNTSCIFNGIFSSFHIYNWTYGWVSTTPRFGMVRLYRLYHQVNSDWVATIDPVERLNLLNSGAGWQDVEPSLTYYVWPAGYK
jgi:hypothetical protein